MAFKSTYELQGVASWCFTKPDLIERGLPAKYKKNALVSVAKNRHDPRNINVFVDGVIVGFVDHPDSIEIIDAIEKKEKIRGRISDVALGRQKDLPPERVIIELSSFKAGYKNERNNSVQKNSPAPEHNHRGKKKENLERQSFEAFHIHSILKKPFSRQPKKKVPVREHWGKMGIYCIWSDTHHTYMGQSKNIGKRIRQHYNELESSSHHNPSLQSDWGARGHGKFRFDVVEEVSDTSKLSQREEYYVRSFDTYYNGYNATPGGESIPESENSENASSRTPNSEFCDVTKAQKKADFKEGESEYKYGGKLFVDLFDGRYYLGDFSRLEESGIVRIKYRDEVWCYKSDSEYHAELLVRWFSSTKRGYSGNGFDWTIHDEK